MDHSTDDVTIIAETISDVYKIYESKRNAFKNLFKIAEDYDLSDPGAMIPIVVYHDVCDWIEQNLGKFNLMKMGTEVGESAYYMMVKNNMVKGEPTPINLMHALRLSAQKGIQDPKKRGWEVLNSTEDSILMRKTQTFNATIQLGLLKGVIQKSGVEGVRVSFHSEVKQGAEYDEYLIKWRT